MHCLERDTASPPNPRLPSVIPNPRKVCSRIAWSPKPSAFAIGT